MSADEGSNVPDGLGLAHSCGRDRHPRPWLRNRTEGANGEEMGERLGISAQVDDALGPDQLKPEARLFCSRVGEGVEEDGEAFFHLKARMDFVSAEETNTLGTLLEVGLHERVSTLLHGRRAGEGSTAEIMAEIEDMGAEDPEIEGAAARVFLSSGADLEKLSDRAVLDQFGDNRQDGVVAIAMGEGEAGSAFFASGDDGIGFEEIAAKGFFHIETARPGVDRGEDHVVMLVHMPRADRDELGFGFREHLSVVGKGVFRCQVETFDGLCPTRLDGVRDADDFCSG